MILESSEKDISMGTVYHKGHLNSIQSILERFRGNNFVTLLIILLEYFMSTPYHFILDGFQFPPLQ